MPKKLLILTLFGFSLLFGFQAFAFNVTYTSDSDILLTAPNIIVTVLAGSKADTVAVDANTITVTISNPDTFTIRSNNRYNLTNDAVIGVTCLSDYSELVIPQQSGTRTVTITPSTSTCSYPSVVVIPSTPAPTPTPTPTTTTTATSTSTKTSAVESAELIRAQGDFRVYVVKNNFKRHIINLEAFNAGGYKWSDIQSVSAANRDQYPDVVLLRAESGIKVYKIENGTRVWIKTVEEFESAGYKWSEIFDISLSELNVYPEGEIVAAAFVKVVSYVKILNVRSDGSLSGKIIGKLYAGNVISLLGEKGGWYNVKLSDGTIGWIFAKYAKK